MAEFEVNVLSDHFRDVERALKTLLDYEIYVGIPEDRIARETAELDRRVTNAQLLFIHTNGSPINKIPPRPVIEPAIEANRDKIACFMQASAKNVLDNDIQQAEINMQKAGMAGQNASRAWFLDARNNWPPNSPRTAARKIAKGSTDPRPLIDTGEMRKSITYFVNNKGARLNYD